jgi:hypothetical protein
MKTSTTIAGFTLGLVIGPIFQGGGPALAEQAAAPESAVVIDVVAEGDLGDDANVAALAKRCATLTRTLKTELQTQGLYRVAPSNPTTEPISRFSGRNELHTCRACLQEIGQSLGASRVFSSWVFRMSNLVLSLQTQVLDARTGAVIWVRHLSFRGDNDRSWERATAYLLREVKETPADKR